MRSRTLPGGYGTHAAPGCRHMCRAVARSTGSSSPDMYAKSDQVLRAFAGQILNTHPAPLPRFGGKGMYGDHVHRAVLESGEPQSAATVHLVEAEYDSGPVIATQPVAVIPGDSVASLRERVQAAERELLITTLNRLADRHRPTTLR